MLVLANVGCNKKETQMMIEISRWSITKGADPVVQTFDNLEEAQAEFNWLVMSDFVWEKGTIVSVVWYGEDEAKMEIQSGNLTVATANMKRID